MVSSIPIKYKQFWAGILMGLEEVLQLRVREDLVIMVIKGIPQIPDLKNTILTITCNLASFPVPPPLK